MKKIKFRGKSIDNGEWIHGFLIEICGECFIVGEGNYLTAIGQFDVEYSYVDCKSVGQYTGIKDINGKEIYEGDIVRQTVSGKIYVVSYDYDFLGFRPFFSVYEGYKVYEIIGNIYDNPDLKGKNEKV